MIFFTKAGLQIYLRLATSGMTRDTFIKHKEVTMIYEENESVITNYNVLLTQPESKLVAQPTINYIMTKQPLTCSNYGKTGHAKETCHNTKREKHVILVVPIKLLNQ
jgi:hypothetical protein